MDRGALVALYRAAGGANWKNNDNWVSGTPIGQWYGVTTDSYDRVMALRLNENGLIGEIAEDLGNLTGLYFLSLSANRLTGEIPSKLGNLTNLELSVLVDNQLTGEIPPELGSLPYLESVVARRQQPAYRVHTQGRGGICRMAMLPVLGLEYCRDR